MSSPLTMDFTTLVESDPALFDVQTSAAGPAGSLPLTEELLRKAPSGDLFGWTQDAGMGWNPAELGRPRVPDPQHLRRPARRRRQPDRAGLSHRPLGSRSADEGGGGGTASAAAAFPSPASAPIPATAARRARPA